MYAAFAISFCAGISAAVYLIAHDYPWWAFFVLLITSSLSARKES